ncbi:MAG: hypothetical protein ACREJ6_14345 [Candidatus Methylomirabilis sp.]
MIEVIVNCPLCTKPVAVEGSFGRRLIQVHEVRPGRVCRGSGYRARKTLWRALRARRAGVAA